jgi:hypothetical protein
VHCKRAGILCASELNGTEINWKRWPRDEKIFKIHLQEGNGKNYKDRDIIPGFMSRIYHFHHQQHKLYRLMS